MPVGSHSEKNGVSAPAAPGGRGVDLALVQAELVGVVIESDDHAATGVGTAHWAIFAALLTYRPQLNHARDFREAQTPSAILNRGVVAWHSN